jgi:drug/metabolite transporter (DMT)-like permease
MNNNINKTPGTFQVVLAYLIVYIVWGSTYFFISRALHGFPPFMLGAIRFIIAGLLMMIWAIWKKENLLNRASIRLAAVSGFLVLFIGNGVVIFVEQYVGSAWVAIIISAAPLWYVVYDKPHWRENFSSKSILTGLFLGLIGIFLLFLPNISASYNIGRNPYERFALFALIVGSMSWVVGSLFAKYKKTDAPATVNTSWQMFFAGIYFLAGAFISGEFKTFQLSSVPAGAWYSILAYSCFVWLMEVRSPAQVSTYAYVNPVVAVLLGVFIAAEKVNSLQIAGLIVILLSVLMINLNKYIKKPRLA